MSIIFKVLVPLLPWFLKRILLNRFFNYKLHKDAYIGLSWIYPANLEMKPHSKIGHFNVAIHLDGISMGEYASIARGNWITGFSSKSTSTHFSHQLDRVSELSLGVHSAITKHHHIDCTNKIIIGNYTTIAGYNSQFLTHSIDLVANRQDSNPIFIGDYCFVGTNVVVLGGAILPNYCVLGAKSLLNKKYLDMYTLYGGVPAKRIVHMAENSQYFLRKIGFVY